MAIKHVVTHGYGFGDGTKFIVTHGYGFATTVAESLTFAATLAASIVGTQLWEPIAEQAAAWSDVTRASPSWTAAAEGTDSWSDVTRAI